MPASKYDGWKKKKEKTKQPADVVSMTTDSIGNGATAWSTETETDRLMRRKQKFQRIHFWSHCLSDNSHLYRTDRREEMFKSNRIQADQDAQRAPDNVMLRLIIRQMPFVQLKIDLNQPSISSKQRELIYHWVWWNFKEVDEVEHLTILDRNRTTRENDFCFFHYIVCPSLHLEK